MHARRTGLLCAWIGTLALLAWAATPEGSNPTAEAWDSTTFSTGLAGPGRPRMAAREGGYAAAFAPRARGYEARALGEAPRASDAERSKDELAERGAAR